jgi:hypothetical protein
MFYELVITKELVTKSFEKDILKSFVNKTPITMPQLHLQVKRSL